MEYRRVGDSGLVVSELSLGTATFAGKGEFFGAWGDTDVERARRLIDLALEAEHQPRSTPRTCIPTARPRRYSVKRCAADVTTC